jgi:hypothetical protein
MDKTNQSDQEETKPLFSGVDSQGKERLFTSVEDAQKSWQSSQDFIKDKVEKEQSLEAKVQQLEAQLNQSLKLEEALAQLQSKEESPVKEPETPQATETTPQLDVEQLTAQITESIMGKLSSSQQEEIYSNNQAESMQAAQAVHGEEFETKLRETAKDLGMSDSDIVNTAQTNPTLFKKVFGLDKQQPKSYTPNSSSHKVPDQGEPKLNIGGGFTASQKLETHLANMQAIAKKRGLKLKY